MDLFEYAKQAKEKSDQLKQSPDESIFTVAEITREVKGLIVERFGRDKFWVKGEISNFKGKNQSGHMYFRLKDASAVLNCVFFRGANSKLNFELKEGSEVLAFGKMDLWEKGGNYQLIIDEMRQGGEGELYLKFEMLKKKLESEGMFLPEHKKPLPSFASRIGIVTSPTGAVIRDIIHVIRHRCPYVELFLYPVKVQGEGAAEEIAAAIGSFNSSESGIDVLIVGRGGGSIEDLWPFNEEIVARSIFNSNIPIISAVGHQTDFTIADFVADQRAATPSHAAEMVVPNMADLKTKVSMLVKNIVRELIHLKENSHQKLLRLLQSSVLRDPKHVIRNKTQQVDQLTENLRNLLVTKTDDVKERLSKADIVLKMLLQNTLPSKKLRFEKLASNLSLLNPLSILKRGYSVVKTSDGKIIKNASEASAEQELHVKLHQGALLCNVTKIFKS